ncbi:helix-turn-helix transcriptional regulator [Lapillicoccus sp.]|uniref:helix-turn-helix transcriptional regulator n=1 Tax=Lapillicoccus sp. TaxID=1909287 RepID=UPI00344C1DE9
MTPGGLVNPSAIRDSRIAARLTQQELARLVGVAGGDRVSKWECGTAEPRPETLHRLAAVLDRQPVDLLTPLIGVADLRRLRVLAGKTAASVAKAAHLSLTTYQRWEGGDIEHLPPRAALVELGEALGVSPDDVGSAIRAARG